ncbi:hypothetical protein EUX98_g5341 [Antrodiella citrinella]|uniref:Methyltransferase type 11 domain-containing protein n=1 Tax=Antrodiella citrinella TaxID=2447956 RepID=A0A4S4MRP1_9APHY|nr:hypothetical protein EUX98_g5341 [Antrodiella citrinella]
MKLTNALSILPNLWFAIRTTFQPTLRSILANPALLVQPKKLSDEFMAHLWKVYGDGLDEGLKGMKEVLIGDAWGVVLDLGAGSGHTIPYLDRTKVTTYIALEPNTGMHPEIRSRAHAAGFFESDGTFVLLSLGAEKLTLSHLSAYTTTTTTSYISTSSTSTSGTTTERQAGAGVDTIISILTLCTLPHPHRTLRTLFSSILNPGGLFLFFEHVRNQTPPGDAAWWQGFWTPVWKVVFGGCELGRETDVWVEQWGGWAEGGSRRPEHEGNEDEGERLFVHRVGRYVKAKDEAGKL